MKKLLTTLALALAVMVQAAAHEGPALRRPISPSQPAWIVHVDVWFQADPQKVVDMIPEDIRPYVIFNIATSATDSRSPSGPAIYDSWMKVLAQNRVWAMIQCSSGAHSRLPDITEEGYLDVYRKYFEQYPNFLGFNFAEQFWDFGTEGCPTFPQRLQLFADLLPLCHEYGGYLAISFTQAYYSASMMPMAYLKRNADWRNFIRTDKEHFLCFEKYTMSSCFLDIESSCLGAYLGGYAGQYGIRFDRCGWQEQDSEFVTASGAIPVLEHFLLTGETMTDGPELTWQDNFHETSAVSIASGFKSRRWEMFPQMKNISVDIFRKILDGTVRIPTRREVIDRTKIAVQNDIAVKNVADDGEKDSYQTPATLYDGLYRNTADYGGQMYANAWLSNRWWLKSSGRYPTIPSLNAVIDDDAKRLTLVKCSQYSSRWGTVSKKVAELNELFPEEYTGDIYAAHHENTWMTYNPYQYDETTVDTLENGRSYTKRHHYRSTRRASGIVPFLYNTCDSVSLSFAPYSAAVMKEYADSVTFYMTNFRVTGGKEDAPATDVIRICGADAEPQVSWNDRADHVASTVQTEWNDGVLTISVTHNGPLDLTVGCKGRAEGRLTDWTPAVIETPEQPALYRDTLQLECENSDYKNVAAVRTNGYYYGHAGYQGLGFVEMGTASGAQLNDSLNIDVEGDYYLIVRFDPSSAESSKYYVYYNGKRTLVSLKGTPGQWNEYKTLVSLKEGMNRIGFSTPAGSANIFLDCFKLVNKAYAEGIDAAEKSQRTLTAGIYSAAGVRRQQLQPGLNIVVTADGKTRKVCL